VIWVDGGGRTQIYFAGLSAAAHAAGENAERLRLALATAATDAAALALALIRGCNMVRRRVEGGRG